MNGTLSINYNLRHLQNRPMSSALTCLGVALVLFVFTATQMLGAGVAETLKASGSSNQLLIVRSGSQNELQSALSREDVAIILELALRSGAKSPLSWSADAVVLLNLEKQNQKGATSNVTIRGISPTHLATQQVIRPPFTLITGTFVSAGSNEIMVGSAVARRFAGIEIGKNLRLAGVDWRIAGIFDAGNTSFNSEIWVDAEPLLQTIRRTNFSSVTLHYPNTALAEKATTIIESDPRLTVTAAREDLFYASQSEFLSSFIIYLGAFISIVFSSAAITGSMITMYTAVANRRREIGILRTLGFSAGVITKAFVQESLLLSMVGGCLGILAATLLTFLQVGTTNFQTFSDVTFSFKLSSEIIVRSLIFSIVMGVIGGALPAYSAARIKPLDAVRR
jgi:putative ABC transport system permease protein